LTSNHLPFTARGSIRVCDFEFLHERKITYGTSVALLRCPFVPENDMYKMATEVFVHPLKWNISWWPILCRCDVKVKQKCNTHKKIIYKPSHITQKYTYCKSTVAVYIFKHYTLYNIGQSKNSFFINQITIFQIMST
jgi:hypothetical protein